MLVVCNGMIQAGSTLLRAPHGRARAGPTVPHEVARECSIDTVRRGADRYSRADRVVHFLNRCYARLPRRSKAILHRTGAWRLLKRGGVLRPVYDRRTLLHPDHISPTRGAIGTWRTALSAEEIARLSTRYAAWIRDAGYEP